MELGATLDVAGGSSALDALRTAARALGGLHRWSRGCEAEWLAQWPRESAPELLPGYDRCDRDLAAPFERFRSPGGRIGLRRGFRQLAAKDTAAPTAQWNRRPSPRIAVRAPVRRVPTQGHDVLVAACRRPYGDPPLGGQGPGRRKDMRVTL